MGLGAFANKNWRGSMQKVSLSADEAFGEELQLIPIKPPRPNFSTEPDFKKMACVTGVFSWPAKEVRLDDHTTVISRDPVVSFHRNGLPYPLKRGDWVERCDGTRFEITAVEPDGVVRIECDLVQMGIQNQ